MERKIRIRYTCNSFIHYQNEIYESYNHLYIARRYDVRTLILNQKEINELIKLKYYYASNGIKHVPSKELLLDQYEKMSRQEKEDGYFLNYRYEIYFYKDITLEEIQSFYDFCLEVESYGMRMKFEPSQAYINAIYLKVPWKKEEIKLQQKMTALFGEPKVIPENEHEKYGGVPNYYIVPISKIDKIIGIKKYRNKTFLEDSFDEHYTGEIEEIILDLHNFDENIYEIFKEHEMVEIKE